MRWRLASVSRCVAAAGLALGLPACPELIGIDEPVPPRLTPCSPADDPQVWASAVAFFNPILQVQLSLNSFSVDGLTLANQFIPSGATVSDTQFDANNLESSTSVVLTLTPDEGADDITVQTGILCAQVARPLLLRFRLSEVQSDGGVAIEDIPTP